MLDAGFIGQTDREKRVEEMENICYGTGHHRDMVPDVAKYVFVTLDNADYRKAEEVRKETLQKLFKAIKESGQVIDYSEFTGEGPFWAIDLDDLQEIIKQEFGVEVEE